MKRFHVHLSVADLQASVRFYSGLFGAEPAVTKNDYAKWMLDEPRINFAISQRGSGVTGLNHLGFQTDTDDELTQVRARFDAADASSTTAEPDARCCYALSNKHWVQDPQGIAWEAFHTLDSIPVWGAGEQAENAATSGCCTRVDVPRTEAAPVAAATGTCCARTETPARSCC